MLNRISLISKWLKYVKSISKKVYLKKKDYLALKDKKDFRKIVRKDFDKYNRFLKKSGLSFDLIKIKHASNLCLNFGFKTETNNSSDEETIFACAKACDMANLSRRN